MTNNDKNLQKIEESFDKLGDSFDCWDNVISKAYENKKKVKLQTSRYVRVLSCVLVVCVLGFFTTTIAGGNFSHFLNIKEDPVKKKAQVINDDENKNEIQLVIDFYEFGYIPKGFLLYEQKTQPEIQELVYTCEETTLTIIQSKEGSVSFNNDNGIEYLYINDIECAYLENNDCYMLVFEVEGIITEIMVSPNENVLKDVKGEFIKIVKNVKMSEIK